MAKKEKKILWKIRKAANAVVVGGLFLLTLKYILDNYMWLLRGLVQLGAALLVSFFVGMLLMGMFEERRKKRQRRKR